MINDSRIGGYTDLLSFLDKEFSKEYDYDMLYKVAYCATINLNKVIDLSYYPTPETKKSNMRHRPIGLEFRDLQMHMH